MPKITVVDTSCLILFHKIGELKLLKKLFGEIFITKAVSKEFDNSLPDWIKTVNPHLHKSKVLAGFLDIGEATSIALAYESKNSLLIIDEIKGRRVAQEMAIRITGSLGILVAAKQKSYIKAVKPIIKKIQATNFRISKDLINTVLEKANEA